MSSLNAKWSLTMTSMYAGMLISVSLSLAQIISFLLNGKIVPTGANFSHFVKEVKELATISPIVHSFVLYRLHQSLIREKTLSVPAA